MKLYIIRHGESENNLNGCYTGWQQVSLTKKGFDEAEHIRKFLEKKTFDKVYTSDLIRAKQTAETALPGCTYEETSLLREINLGELSGKQFIYCEQKYGEEFKKNRELQNWVPYGGENVEIFDERVRLFMDKVAQTRFKYIAAFSHLGFLKGMLRCTLQVKIPRTSVQCPNCTIAIFEYKNKAE